MLMRFFIFYPFFKNLNNKLDTTLVVLYVPTYIYYEHDYPKNAKNERKQFGLNSNSFYSNQIVNIMHFWN